MLMKKSSQLNRVLAVAVLALLLTGCASPATTSTTPAAGPSATEPLEAAEVILMVHDSFAISDELLDAFTNETGIEIKIFPAGDAGTMVNQAVLTVDNPLADVIFGVDNNFLSRALEAGVFEPYESPLLSAVPDELEIDPRVTPIDFGDVCINWDKAYFTDIGLPPPETLLDLTDSAYQGLLVVQHPATSSPGLAFFYSTIAAVTDRSSFPMLRRHLSK
jgi:thiamine transport system substrate-binding protein